MFKINDSLKQYIPSIGKFMIYSENAVQQNCFSNSTFFLS